MVENGRTRPVGTSLTIGDCELTLAVVVTGTLGTGSCPAETVPVASKIAADLNTRRDIPILTSLIGARDINPHPESVGLYTTIDAFDNHCILAQRLVSG